MAELVAQIKAQGIRNYSIFLDGDEVFGYFEHDDLDALDALNAQPTELGERWEAGMRLRRRTRSRPTRAWCRSVGQVFHVE